MGGKLVGWLVAVTLVCTSSGVVEAGPSGGALPPQLVQVLQVAGYHGVPNDAEMVAVNITAVAPAEAGHITAYPCDQDLPTVSNLNYDPDDVVPNLALVRIADDGSICIATHAVVDLVVDVVGYVPAGSTITALDTPRRVTDTRASRRLAGGDRLQIDLDRFVPDDTRLAMFNLTSVGATAPGHTTVFPCTDDVPATSSLNFEPGRTVANFVIARLSPDGRVCLHTHAASHFVVDLVAYSSGGMTTLDRPRRIHDSRATGRPVSGGDTLRLDVTDLRSIPDSATAAVYNLTAAAPAAPGHATSYPCDTRRPEASNLNYRPGQNSANATITKLSATGELCIHTLATTHLVVDLIGYTTDTNDYVPLDPARALDTRRGWGPACDQTLLTPWYGSDVDYSRWFLVEGSGVIELDLPAVGADESWFAQLLPDCSGAMLRVGDALIFAPADGGPRSRIAVGTTDIDSFFDVIEGNHLLGYTCCRDNELTVFDIDSGESLLVLDADGFGGPSVSADGRLIAFSRLPQPMGSVPPWVTVFDTVTNELVLDYPAPYDSTPTISPNGKYLAWGLEPSAHGGHHTAVTTIFGETVALSRLIFGGWSGNGTMYGIWPDHIWVDAEVSIFDSQPRPIVPADSAATTGFAPGALLVVDRR